MHLWKNSKIEPDILAERRDGAIIELDLCPAADLFQFRGHFPEKSILPGVGQLDWAVRFAKDRFSLTQEIAEISRLKFRAILTPDVRVTLQLDFQEDKNRIVFQYFSADKIFSSGILKLAQL